MPINVVKFSGSFANSSICIFSGAKLEDLKEEEASHELLLENDLNYLKVEYIEHARFIIESYLDIDSSRDESSQVAILETGIQFWSAEKLPMTALENFLLEKLDLVYFDLGCLLFW